MSLDFYDRERTPIAYTDDNEHLYAYCGRPVAYIYEGSIYSYPGRHLGSISDDVIRDNHGHIVLYTEESRGGPMKGMLQPVPPKGLKHMRYLKCRRRPKIENPSRHSWWSQIPGHQFFS